LLKKNNKPGAHVRLESEAQLSKEDGERDVIPPGTQIDPKEE
jgi:hypothetical protein